MIHNLTVTGKIPGKPLGEEQRRGNVKVYLSVWSDLIDTFEEAGINILDVGHGENYRPFFPVSYTHLTLPTIYSV